MSTGYPNQPPYGLPSFQEPPRKSGMSWLMSLLLVGAGIAVLCGVLFVVGVWYVASNLDKWVVSLGREAIVAAIEESELPQEEKAEVVTQVDRLVAAYKERKIDQADLERVFTELEDAPALKALALYGIENEFLEGANLPPAELEQARRTFQRALRGVYEGKIREDVFYDALPDDFDDHVRLASTDEPAGAEDEDLRLMLAKLKVIVDNARIPDEPFQLDIGDEVKKLVDKALEGK
jgi:hypothetical protein